MNHRRYDPEKALSRRRFLRVLAVLAALLLTAGPVQYTAAETDCTNPARAATESISGTSAETPGGSQADAPAETVEDGPSEPPAEPEPVKNGWETRNGKRYYYVNGVRKTGLRKIGKYRYYFNKNGVMKTGWLTLKGSRYYFGKNGRMVTGLKKISGRQYYFSVKTGKLLKHPVIQGKMQYRPDKKGKITGYVIQADPLCQRPRLLNGCEIVAWTMMARNAGVKNMDIYRAAAVMPRSDNPQHGFVGDPYSSEGPVQVVYPNGLMGITKKYLGSTVNMTGRPFSAIESKLRKGRIVLAWVHGLDGFGSHTIALTGYDSKKVYYNDPWTGRKSSMSRSAFFSMWAGNANRALSY